MSLMNSGLQTLSPSAINRYLRCQLQFYYRYVAGVLEPEVPDDEQELDNRVFGNVFHEAADIIYHQLPSRVTDDVLAHLLKSKVEIERAVDEAFHRQLPDMPAGGLHIINREVIIHYLRQLLEIDRRLAPFTILGLECDVYDQIGGRRIGGRIDRLDLVGEGTPQERIRVVDYKTGGSRLKAMADVDAIFDPAQVHNHSDYYLQTILYADIVSRQRRKAVSPALLFIQHAGAADYDPTLKLGKELITDVARYSERFNELLAQTVDELFNPAVDFRPTDDATLCRSCPYAQFCRR